MLRDWRMPLANSRSRKNVRIATALERAVVSVCAESVIEDLRNTLNRASSVIRRFKDDGDSEAIAAALDSIRYVLPSTAVQLRNVKRMVGFGPGSTIARRRGNRSHDGLRSA